LNAHRGPFYEVEEAALELRCLALFALLGFGRLGDGALVGFVALGTAPARIEHGEARR